MTTIINAPPTVAVPSEESSGLVGIITGIVVLAVIGFIIFVYVLPVVRESQRSYVPSGSTITVPDTINVNLKK